MPKVAESEGKLIKEKITISLDGDLLGWLDALVNARARQGKDGRSTVINQILKAKKRRSFKLLAN